MQLNYNEICKNSKDKSLIRKTLVESAGKIGVKPTAREFSTTPKTVRKWMKRLKSEGKAGLADRSRRPKTSPNQMKPHWRFKIADVVEKAIRDNKRTNAELVKRKNGIPHSRKSVLKEMKKHGYDPKVRRKSRRRKDLREVKAKMRSFEKLQVDTKYLDDIPEFYADWKRFSLPRY